MSMQDDLTAAQRSLDELSRSVEQLERRMGDELDIRRVHTDAEHLRESLELLREHTREAATPDASGRSSGTAPAPEVVRIPDTPYDASLWTDAEDEGLGARDRHAP